MSHPARRLVLAAAAAGALMTAVAVTPAAAGEGTVVYTETNSPSGNTVLAYRLGAGGLRQIAAVDAGGLGSGRGLGSQGAVGARAAARLAVGAGSHQVWVFRIGDHGVPQRTDVAATGGRTPVSVTTHDDVVYVLNAGDSTVAGFRLVGDRLVAIPGSVRTLPGSGGAQISFDRTGTRLVVTEKATNTLDVLPVVHGVAGPAVSNAADAVTPFGFAVDRRNRLIVSDAVGGAAGASALSSYAFAGATTVTPIGHPVGDTQTAACWVALTGDGRVAFTTNTGSGTISSYRVGTDGTLTRAQAVAATPGAGPIDLTVSGGSTFTLNNGSHTIAVDAIGAGGTLTATTTAPVPAGSVGLAAIED